MIRKFETKDKMKYKKENEICQSEKTIMNQK